MMFSWRMSIFFVFFITSYIKCAKTSHGNIVYYWFAVARFIKNQNWQTFQNTLMSACLVQGPRNGFHVIPQYWFKGHDFNTIPGWLILRGFTGAAQGTQGGKQVSRGPFSSSGWRTCVDFSYVMTTATVIQQDSFFKVFPSVVVSVFRCLCLNIGFSVFLCGRNSSMNALCLSHSLINSFTNNFTNDIQLY